MSYNNLWKVVDEVAKRKNNNNPYKSLNSFLVLVILSLILSASEDVFHFVQNLLISETSYAIENIPEYFGKPYVVINDNVPNFSIDDYTTDSFEHYSEFDSLGRCGVAFANVSLSTMPTQERESIGMVKPSGWQTVKYDFVDGKYLYNRCHLIGYQLTGENANEKNLITCTRSMNTVGMLEFENQVAKYVKETGNHVLYRVTPIFLGTNLVASGVLMEAYSVEDFGEGISFNVYVYNVEDKIEINYKDGTSKLK